MVCVYVALLLASVLRELTIYCVLLTLLSPVPGIVSDI